MAHCITLYTNTLFICPRLSNGLFQSPCDCNRHFRPHLGQCFCKLMCYASRYTCLCWVTPVAIAHDGYFFWSGGIEDKEKATPGDLLDVGISLNSEFRLLPWDFYSRAKAREIPTKLDIPLASFFPSFFLYMALSLCHPYYTQSQTSHYKLREACGGFSGVLLILNFFWSKFAEYRIKRLPSKATFHAFSTRRAIARTATTVDLYMRSLLGEEEDGVVAVVVVEESREAQVQEHLGGRRVGKWSIDERSSIISK